MDMLIFWFFFKKFLVGCGIGIFLKFFLAVTLKWKATGGGMLRTAIVCGFLYILLTLYVINRIG